MTHVICDGEDLHEVLIQYQKEIDAAVAGLTQLAKENFLQKEAPELLVDVRLKVEDVATNYGNVMILGHIAGERPRSFLDRFFDRRLHVGKLLLGDFGEMECLDAKNLGAIQNLRKSDVVVISGALRVVYDTGDTTKFGQTEYYGVGWKMLNCRFR